jgi:hypothetical protein
MKLIHYEKLVSNNNYYIYHNDVKYSGTFVKLYYYDYFWIAEFKDVINLISNEKTKMNKNFIIQNYYYNLTYFYIPELESLFLEQVLRQKINDAFFAHTIMKNTL